MVTIRQSVEEYIRATQDVLNLDDLSDEERHLVDETFQRVLVILKDK
jgi:hypothetical protein